MDLFEDILINEGDNPLKSKHISVSQINMYARCPMQWKFRYIDGMVLPPDFGLVIGSAAHKAIEHNYKQKIESKLDAPIEEVRQAYSDEFDKKKEIVPQALKFEEGRSKDMGYKLVDVFHKELAPKIQPVKVEYGFQLTIPKTEIRHEKDSVIIDVPWMFQGFIDLIDDKKTVVDNKTAGRSYQPDAADDNLQLSGYSWAYKELFDELPNEQRFDVMVKTQTPKTQQISSKVTQDKVDRFLMTAHNVYKGISSGVFYPRRGTDCGWCGYKNVCKDLRFW